MNVLLRIVHLKEEQLGDDNVRHVVVHGRSQEDDAIDKEPGVDVVSAFAASRLLHDNRSVTVMNRFHFRKEPGT
jgi:hypothetical protein